MNFDPKDIPIEIAYVLLAISGGIARYLNSFVSGGTPFSWGVLLASAAMAGFSGYIFALFALTTGVNNHMVFIFAGLGGFFGEQTLKFLLEMVTKRPSDK